MKTTLAALVLTLLSGSALAEWSEIGKTDEVGVAELRRHFAAKDHAKFCSQIANSGLE